MEHDVLLSLLAAAMDCLLRQPVLTLQDALALDDIARARERLQGSAVIGPTSSPAYSSAQDVGRCSPSPVPLGALSHGGFR